MKAKREEVIKHIYGLGLNESTFESRSGYYLITRVPGGWLYDSWNQKMDQASGRPIFIPETFFASPSREKALDHRTV